MRFLRWVLFWFSTAAFANAPVEIVFWHSLAGELGTRLQEVVDAFNKDHPSYRVLAVYKGDYVETLTSYAAAYRAHRAPDLVQIYEVGKTFMIAVPGVIKPVDEIMDEQGFALPYEDMLGRVLETYSDKGRLVALPFNLSIPVIFYNEDALSSLGVTPEHFPKTWEAFYRLASQLKARGYTCAFTSAYPAWALVESYGAIHQIDLIHPDNMALKPHYERLLKWQRDGLFEYGGKTDEAMALFTSGHCAMLSQSSGSYHSLIKLVPFKVGVAMMPYDNNVVQERGGNVVGGAAIYATSGRSNETNRGIGLFFDYLLSPDTILKWHQKTGYLPIGLKGRYQSVLEGGDKTILSLAMNDLGASSKASSMSVPLNQLRLVYEQGLTALFAHQKPAESVLKESAGRIVMIEKRFKENTETL